MKSNMESPKKIITTLHMAEEQLKCLQERIDYLEGISQKYNKLCELTPAGLPDGTGFIPDPKNWIIWAKRKLGYRNK